MQRPWPSLPRCILIALLCAAPVAGCRATLVPPDGSDPSRVQVQALEKQVAQLESRNRELAAQSAALRAQLESVAQGSGSVPSQEVIDATPRLASLALGANAAIVCPAEAGCIARLYLEPRDGMGRFLQVTGRAEVSVALVQGGGQLQLLGQRAYSPAELRDAFRSGFMGTHYTLEVPVQLPAGLAPGTALAVTAELVDGWTGLPYRATGSVPAPGR